MKILIIDSHKGTKEKPQNLHWLNAEKIQQHLISVGNSVDLIWSYPTVNDTISTGYDVIIFNHASRYSYISDEWLTKNPTAKIFYITNEYNLGEPVMLWSHVKKLGLTYDVIANHTASASKVVTKYVNNWNFVNLNALIIDNKSTTTSNDFFAFERSNCVYYGSFRKDRVKYFSKYLTGKIVISTHKKNRYKFEAAGITGPFKDRLNWNTGELSSFKTSLYIEDHSTHKNYNCLANRFYEALNHETFPLFDKSCINSINLSGYSIPEFAMVDSPAEVDYITSNLPNDYMYYLHNWFEQAAQEKRTVLDHITTLVTS